MKRFGPKRQPGPFKVTGLEQITNSINFWKKEKNWQTIFENALANTAVMIRDAAEQKVYERWNYVTGSVGKSIEPMIGNFGNKAVFQLVSDHPAAKIIEFGGYSPMPSVSGTGFGSRNHNMTERLKDYAIKYPSVDSYWWFAKNIFKNQPFAEGTFACRDALLENMSKINSQIMLEGNRLKRKASGKS